jgi:hypothetical protein
MRRSCSKRRLKAAAPRRRRLRCVAFCAHVRYRDPSTVEANRADCNGRSPHMRTRVPPAIVRGARSNSWRSRFARFVRARGWGLGRNLGDGTRETRPTRPASWRLAIQFLSEENEYGRFCRYGDHNADGRRSKARPNEGGSRREREDPDGIVYSRLRPRWAGGGVQDALRACLRACGHASGQRTHDIVQRTRVQHRARHGGHVLHAWASR